MCARSTGRLALREPLDEYVLVVAHSIVFVVHKLIGNNPSCGLVQGDRGPVADNRVKLSGAVPANANQVLAATEQQPSQTTTLMVWIDEEMHDQSSLDCHVSHRCPCVVCDDRGQIALVAEPASKPVDLARRVHRSDDTRLQQLSERQQPTSVVVRSNRFDVSRRHAPQHDFVETVAHTPTVDRQPGCRHRIYRQADQTAAPEKDRHVRSVAPVQNRAAKDTAVRSGVGVASHTSPRQVPKPS